MESKYDLGNILQPNIELHQAEDEEPNGLVVGNDPKTAFLTELKELMERYDACINLSWNDYFDKDNAPCIDIDIELKGEKNNGYIGVCYSDMLNKAITPSNIFDYDKV